MMIALRNAICFSGKKYGGLCLTALDATGCVIGMSITGSPNSISLQYSTNGISWQTFTPGTTTVSLT